MTAKSARNQLDRCARFSTECYGDCRPVLCLCSRALRRLERWVRRVMR